jgi:hypothetical protein
VLQLAGVLTGDEKVGVGDLTKESIVRSSVDTVGASAPHINAEI